MNFESYFIQYIFMKTWLESASTHFSAITQEVQWCNSFHSHSAEDGRRSLWVTLDDELIVHTDYYYESDDLSWLFLPDRPCQRYNVTQRSKAHTLWPFYYPFTPVSVEQQMNSKKWEWCESGSVSMGMVLRRSNSLLCRKWPVLTSCSRTWCNLKKEHSNL